MTGASRTFGGAILFAIFACAPALANVSLKNGNFNVGYTDVIASGGLGMKVERVYNSKSVFKGIFGWGWGCEFEVHLEVMDDGSLTVHEYGGGAENIFMPKGSGAGQSASSSVDVAPVVAAMAQAAVAAGRFGSNTDLSAYRRELEERASKRADEARDLRGVGLLGPVQPPAEGSVFLSAKFGSQVVTRTREGYERRMERGRFEAYDFAGRLQRVWDANHNFIGLNYDSRGHIAEMYDSQGDVYTFAFNAVGLVESITDDRGRAARYEYSESDELIRSSDVEGNVYRDEYDPRHNMTAIRYSDGTSMEMAYYSRAKNENIQRLKDRDGTVTEYGYTFYDTPGTHFAVDVNVKAENGNPLSQNRYEYFMSYTNGVEHLDRLINTTNGDRIDTVYNPDGYPLSITTAQGTTTIAYDDRGHVIRKATPTETTKLTYDRTLGKVSSVTVSRGKVVERSQFAYDVKGNLARAEDSKHRMVVLQYDEVGRISVMTDQNNRTLRFTYNRQSKPTTMELDGIGQIHVTYNDSGEITKVDSDQGHTIASQVTEFFQELLDVIRPAGVSLSF